MEVMQSRKNRGFLSIELMLVLTVMAITGGITLYVGKICKDRAIEFSRDAEAKFFIATLLEYHEMTGKWPIAADNFVDIRAVALELRKAFDEVLWNNPYSLNRENPKKFPNVWIRIDARKRFNHQGESVLQELRRRTGRNVSEREVKDFESVLYFLPKQGDKPWVQSVEQEDIGVPGAVLG